MLGQLGTSLENFLFGLVFVRNRKTFEFLKQEYYIFLIDFQEDLDWSS